MNFVQKYLKGLVTEEDIDDYVDMWHESTCDLKIHEYLGMTWQQYSLWAVRPSKLKEILRELTMFYAVFRNPKNGLLYSEGIIGEDQYKFVTYYQPRYGAMSRVYKRHDPKEYMETVGYILNNKIEE